MNLKRNLTLTRAGVIEALQFRLSFVVIVIGNLLYLIVVYFLWKAIYASAGTDVVNGMTFSDTVQFHGDVYCLGNRTRNSVRKDRA